MYRSGFVTVLGRPNTGKSTLVNALVGKKIAAVTPHPQTTRTHLLGVFHGPEGQIVFVDTPGVHRGKGPLARELSRSVRAALEGRDLALFLVDVTRPWGAEDAMALELLTGAGPRAAAPRDPLVLRGDAAPPVFLVLNKVDLLPQRDELLPLIAACGEHYPFAEIVPISALKKFNLKELLRLIFAALPEGPAYFPEGQATDQPEQFWISEVIREQAMLAMRAEIPHALRVRVEADRMRRSQGKPLRVIEAVLICEREGQKAALVGRGGATIGRIGSGARRQLEAAWGMHVLLQLRVLVRAGWREDPQAIADLDFHNLG